MEKYGKYKAILIVDKGKEPYYPETGITIDEKIASLVSWMKAEEGSFLEIENIKEKTRKVFSRKELERNKDKKVKDILDYKYLYFNRIK